MGKGLIRDIYSICLVTGKNDRCPLISFALYAQKLILISDHTSCVDPD